MNKANQNQNDNNNNHKKLKKEKNHRQNINRPSQNDQFTSQCNQTEGSAAVKWTVLTAHYSKSKTEWQVWTWSDGEEANTQPHPTLFPPYALPQPPRLTGGCFPTLPACPPSTSHRALQQWLEPSLFNKILSLAVFQMPKYLSHLILFYVITRNCLLDLCAALGGNRTLRQSAVKQITTCFCF